LRVERFSFSGSWWGSGAVVAAVGVDREGADDLAGGGVDDAHVEVVDEHQDGGSVEMAAESDVVELAADAERDVAVADAVAPDAVVGLVGGGWAGFGSGVVGGDRCPISDRAVGSLLVVLADELVERGLQLVERRCWVDAQPAFEGLVEAFDFAAGGGVVGREFFWVTWSASSSVS
jgi:hypothetical protein